MRECTNANPLCVFFDVDGTVINTRSLLSFLDYLNVQLKWHESGELAFFEKNLYSKFIFGDERDEVNRFYFTLLRNKSVEEIKRLGSEWFSRAEVTHDFYNNKVVERLKNYRRGGAKIVFVTGSFMPLLGHLGAKLNVDEILCTTPEEIKGVYSGELRGVPCIGNGKRAKILQYAAVHDVDLNRCHAYGDDDSDLPMLRSVGNGVKIISDNRYVQEEREILNKWMYLKLQLRTNWCCNRSLRKQST